MWTEEHLRGLDTRVTTAAEVAAATARRLGADDVHVRLETTVSGRVLAEDGRLCAAGTRTEHGLSVRVQVGGATAFAASTEDEPGTARALAEHAVGRARDAAAALGRRPGSPASRGSWARTGHDDSLDGVWASAGEVDPCADGSVALVDHARRTSAGRPGCTTSVETTASRRTSLWTDGRARTVQTWTTVHPVATVLREHGDGGFASVRTWCPPVAGGAEVLAADASDFAQQLARLHELAAEQSHAPVLDERAADVVLDGSHTWLLLHETLGHALEVDRVLGHEAGLAGTSFLDVDDLREGSRVAAPGVHVVADRTDPAGLAGCGWDDEGEPASRWSVVEDGRLVGAIGDRRTRTEIGGRAGAHHGCSRAAGPLSAPLTRMPDLHLLPSTGAAGRDDLVAGVEDGVLVIGDGSWSVDSRRRGVQLSGQLAYRIRAGRVEGMVRGAAYRVGARDAWSRVARVGDASTLRQGGTARCGKGLPMQSVPVSHRTPAVLLRDVPLVRTAA